MYMPYSSCQGAHFAGSFWGLVANCEQRVRTAVLSTVVNSVTLVVGSVFALAMSQWNGVLHGTTSVIPSFCFFDGNLM